MNVIIGALHHQSSKLSLDHITGNPLTPMREIARFRQSKRGGLRTELPLLPLL